MALRARRLALALVLGALQAPAMYAQVQPALPPAPIDTIRDLGKLRPGDLLAVNIEGQPEMSGQHLIDTRGFVSVPGLGRFHVAGLTPDSLYPEFAAIMRSRGLEEVDISIIPQIRVIVLGEVTAPKMYAVEPGTRLLQMLAIAGGPTPTADLRRTRVVREGKPYEVDLKAGLAGSPAAEITLFSNDYVVIDRRRGWTAERLTFVASMVTAALTLVNVVLSIQRN